MPVKSLDEFRPGPRILVVDDERLNRDLIDRMLRRDGYQCVCVATGAEAFEALRSERIDLILLDMIMPDTSGIAMLDALRIMGHVPGTPVVILTGLEDDEARAEAFRHGASGFLAKPFSRADLAELVGRLVEAPGSTSQVSQRSTEGGGT